VTLKHTYVGNKLTPAEYGADKSHSVNGLAIDMYVGNLGASAWVVASDAPTAIKNFANMLYLGGYPVWVCDGTADNVQIQAAWDALPTSGGDLNLSVGSFSIDAPIELDSHWCNLSGCGMGTILVPSTTMESILHVHKAGDSTAYLHVHDLYLNGNSETVKGLYVETGTGCWFDHVHIKNCHGYGVDLEYNHSLYFTHCQMNSNTNGIRVGSIGYRVHNVYFDMCLIENNTEIGILLGNVSPVVIRGCTIEANGLQGIKAETVTSGELYAGLIQSCLFEDNNEDEAADTYSIHLIDCNHFAVEDCYGGDNKATYMLFVESACADIKTKNNHWYSTLLKGNGEYIDPAAYVAGDVVTIFKTIDHASLTDGGDATAYMDFDDGIPAGSIIKAVKCDFTQAFNSDDTTTVTMMIGYVGDLDAFNKTADPGEDAFNHTTDVFWGESACQDAVVVSAATPRVTFTEDDDGTDIISSANAQGAVTITITYMKA